MPRSIAGAVAGLCVASLSWGIFAASPAFARGSATLQLSPSHGSGNAMFAANFHVTGSGANCPGGQVDFAFDSQPLASAPLDPLNCTASASMQVPLGAQPGAHKVKGTLTGGSAAASGSATFTVDQGPQSPTGSSPATTQFTPLPYTNTTTTPTKWNPPAYAPQQLPTAAVTCDTSGNHATAPSGDVLVIPAYAAGAHSPAAGSTVVAEPMAGRLPIASVGPTAMTPPRLGADPYQYLEVLEQIDPVVSPKLRLAAAAGESFGCLQVEAFGGPGSGYGYLVYALKSALVISAQDANADGSPFVVPTSTASSAGASTTGGTKSASAPASKGAKPAVTTPGDPAAPKAKYERLVLGYASISWEYQEAAGGDKGILHRGAGTVVPAPPSPPLSYSNLVFAFGGLVAATVALMFAYHSRRRDLARRARRSARHA